MSAAATAKAVPNAANAHATFQASDLQITHSENVKPLPKWDELKFGQDFAPHQFSVKYSKEKGWETPQIKPLENMSIHPAANVLQYGVCCFEGMKAYATAKGETRLFRPEMNMERFARSMNRLSLPSFDQNELISCLEQLLAVDKAWIPKLDGYSLYIRPFAIGTSEYLGIAPPTRAEINIIMCPVGPYYPQGLVPVKVFLDQENVRAFHGGTGHYKVGGNYAPTLYHMEQIQKYDCKQVLYTTPEANGRVVAECGAMNMFFLLEHGGEMELVTPPLDDTILPGVTRDSAVGLCRGFQDLRVSERTLSVEELREHFSRGNVLEIFGTGTACVIQPVEALVMKNGETWEVKGMPKEESIAERVYKTISAIQYGHVEHEWSHLVSQ